MPRDAEPAAVVAAGPWCFAGREAFFPDWETRFRFAPEPLAAPAAQADAARQAQALAARVIPGLARALHPGAEALPDAYWQTLLAPWAVDMARQVVERALRARAMLDAWGRLPLRVPMLPAGMAFHFRDERDFTLRGALGADFNHWLFSRLLEAQWPACWIAEPAQAAGDSAPPASSNTAAGGTGVRQRPGQWLRHLARRLNQALPFPRLKGMSAAQTLRFSLALLHPCRQPDHSLDLSSAFAWPDATAHGEQAILPEQAGAAASGSCLPPSLNANPLTLFLPACPASLRALRHPTSLSVARRPRLRVAGIAAYEDAAYRQRLAIWRGRGNRLAFAQHGGNYGFEAVPCETAFVEYSQDAFFTWGWQRHGGARGNFIPLPSPQLAAEAGMWHGEKGEDLLFVGAEMAAVGYRLDSHPTPLQLVEYRQDKEWFVEALGRDLQSRTLYRPYFSLPGCLEDAAWLLPRFPRLRLCTGPLLPQLLSCRLLVLDHHGTTLLEALAANAPVLLYWTRAHWPLTPEGNELLDILERAGIWHPSAEEAAAKVREVWANPAAWWRSPPVQAARRAFCEAQARLVDTDITPLWTKTLQTL